MKKILLVNFLMAGVISYAQSYCTPAFANGCTGGDVINSFAISAAGLNHPNTGCSAGSYGDYTSMTAYMNAGLSYDFSATHGYGSQYVRVWIDFNNDGTFDDTAPELVASASSSNVGGVDITSGTIAIPATATPGTYRMRVADRFFSDPIPCNIEGFGEAHDYTVVIGATPSCYAPTGVSASAITTSTAQISWSAASPVPTNGYEYYYSSTGVFPTPTTQASGSSSTLTADLSLLMAATVYNVWVRSVCNTNDKSGWSQHGTFATACTTFNVPYTENFEAVTEPGMPLCTTVVNEGAANEWETVAYNDNGFTGNTLSYSSDYMEPANTWFFTPGINLTAGVSYRVKYKYANSPGTPVLAEKLKVAYGTSTTGGAMTNTLADHSNITTSTATSNFVDFTPTATGVYHIGFNAYSDADMYNLFVDDISVYVTPTCSEPTLVSVSNITANGTTVSWTAANPVPTNGYDIYYSPNNTPPTATSTPNFPGITATTYNIPGLSPATPYYVWVRSVCNANDKSAWSDAVTFTTACSSTNLPYVIDFENVSTPELPDCTMSANMGSGNTWETSGAPFGIQGLTTDLLRYRYNSDNPADAWFFTQGLNLTAGVQYTISYKYANSSTTYIEKLKVAFGTSATSAAMTNSIVDYPSINDNTLHTESLTFTVPATGVYYFGFNAYSDADQDRLYIDDISIDNANLAVSEVSQKKNELRVYPNPFTDVVNISDIKNVKNVLVTDASGRLVKTIANPDAVLHLNDLKQGLYMVTLEMKDGSKQTIKAIKK